MRNIIAIFRRELYSYFVSPIAYIVIGVFLAIVGYFFYNVLGGIIQAAFQARMQAMQGGMPPEIDVPGLVVRNILGLISFIVLFMVPMLTMGSYAGERKGGTMELLMTSPLTELQIVLGKFFAGLTLFLVMIAPTLLFILYMSRFSDPGMSWRVLWSGYLGIVLLGAVLIAIGLFISSTTENQIIAAVVTFAVFIIMWVLDIGGRNASSTVGEVLQHLSVLRHFENFSQGIIDTTSVVFYLSLTMLGLFLTLRSLESMRWRRA